ncbi:MAG: APC family permease, partial [Candidatus Omnitrophica bacterium]|nr:APC family permease [Candidatus Omnitrophota bacterium]
MAQPPPPEAHSFDVSEPSSGKVPTLDRGSLHRVIGVRELFAIGYSDVGSSIYYALGITTLYALGAAPLALAIAGVVFFCTVLTYAECASALPEAGGSASFARHGFNDLISFIAGWALLLDYIVTIAISAYTIGP